MLIKFIGLVTKKRSKVTKKNDIMAFVTAEDESGEAEIIIFPSLYAECGGKIAENKVFVFTGTPEIKEAYGDETADNISILLKSVCTPEEAAANIQNSEQIDKHAEATAKSLYIKATSTNSHRLNDAIALAAKTPGESRILVYFEDIKKLRAAKDKSTVISDRLIRQLSEIMGSENIAVK